MSSSISVARSEDGVGLLRWGSAQLSSWNFHPLISFKANIAFESHFLGLSGKKI